MMCLKKKRNAVWMMYARIKHKKEKEKKEVYVGINKSYTCHNQSFICISYKKKVLYAYDMKKKKKRLCRHHIISTCVPIHLP